MFFAFYDLDTSPVMYIKFLKQLRLWHAFTLVRLLYLTDFLKTNVICSLKMTLNKGIEDSKIDYSVLIVHYSTLFIKSDLIIL